tara:strand:- start:461 stop:763 length:303 start_codon:yes stop_codon:yes gene_type:complete
MNEVKNMQYWKRKNALPGIIHEGDKNLPDGRSLSAPLQANTKSGSETADTLPSDRDLKSQKVRYQKKGEKPQEPTYAKQQMMSTEKKTKAKRSIRKRMYE